MIRASNDFTIPLDVARARTRLGSAAVLSAALPGVVVVDDGVAGAVQLHGTRLKGRGIVRTLSPSRIAIDWTSDEGSTGAPDQATVTVHFVPAGDRSTRVEVDIALSEVGVPASARGTWSDAAFRAIADFGAVATSAAIPTNAPSTSQPSQDAHEAGGSWQERVSAQQVRLAASAAAGVAAGAIASWLRTRKGGR